MVGAESLGDARNGLRKAKVAAARKLAVILHRTRVQLVGPISRLSCRKTGKAHIFTPDQQPSGEMPDDLPKLDWGHRRDRGARGIVAVSGPTRRRPENHRDRTRWISAKILPLARYAKFPSFTIVRIAACNIERGLTTTFAKLREMPEVRRTLK
jgi:hypothetical protein